jgi:hypothetical protein
MKLKFLNLTLLLDDNNPITPVPQRSIELIVNVGDMTKTGIIVKKTTRNIHCSIIFLYEYDNNISEKTITKFDKISTMPNTEYFVPNNKYKFEIRIPVIFDMNEVPEFGLPVYLPLII